MNALTRRLQRLEARHDGGQCPVCGVALGGLMTFDVTTDPAAPRPVPCSTCHRPLRFTFLIASANEVGRDGNQ